MVGTSAAWANAPDFGLYDQLLLQNVRNGFVNYNGFAADQRFASFVAQLEDKPADPLRGQDDRLAFYINAYNALAIQAILDGRSPVGWWGRRSFFDRASQTLSGQRISLNQLEHEFIEPLGDPRTHFAIACASMSCARLASRAYLPESIDLQLHVAARRFVNDPARNRFDLERRIAFLSPVFANYADEFARAGGTLQRYVARFVDDARIQDALRADSFEVRYITDDWNLNGNFDPSNP